MDVSKRVEALLARRHFTPDAKGAALREKTRQALLNTLAPLERIKSYDEEDAYENAPDEYRNDSSDGVRCTTIAELVKKQQARRAALRSRTNEFFGQEEDVVVAVMDVDRHIKWGMTALHFAAQDGNEEECDKLVAAGANKTAIDNGGKMPWEKARFSGFDELAEKLKP